MKKYTFFNNCVHWDSLDVNREGGLCDMIDQAIDITRRTFLKHVDRQDLIEFEEMLSYEKHWKHGLTMASDYYVTYHRSKLHGERVYFFKHSAIEYVFR